jgi:hypothetical protein
MKLIRKIPQFPVPGLLQRRAKFIGRSTELLMPQGDRTYAFDANMGISDGAVAVTATGYAQYAGADGIVDFGGNQNVTITLPSIADVSTITPQQARIDAVLVLDLTAIKTSAGNELYKLILTGSNDPAFAAGNCFMLGMIEFGHVSVIDTFNGATTAAPNAIGGSRYEVLFAAEQNNVKFQFCKLRAVLSGTTPTITFKAFVAVLPEP